MRYGMNPHQSARMSTDVRHPVTLLNGEPSLINWLDMLNAWQLVRDAAGPLRVPVATSFKHVSPAGVATAGTLDEAMIAAWGERATEDSPVLSAYVRARDVDPKSSFGDVIALSHPCDVPTARFLSSVVADAIIAPGFEDGAAAVLAGKKKGKFLVAEVDPSYEPPEWESRTLFGVDLEQQRDTAELDVSAVPEAYRADALLGLATLRYTQSNSVTVGTGGMVLGIGAGQQNRVDCTQLAGSKARTWWLRRHPIVRALHSDGMSRQDTINWQVRFAEGTLTASQEVALGETFGAAAAAAYRDAAWREEHLKQWNNLVMCSDGFLPFTDNVEVADEFGTRVIVEPGGSIRTPEVNAACSARGITHATTGLRLFHH